MTTWRIIPTETCNQIHFFSRRSDIRTSINLPFKEVRKSLFAKNTMDVFEGFHIMYDENDLFTAIEFFSNTEVFVNNMLVFPGSLENAKRIICDLGFDGYGYVSENESVGITLAEDGVSIDGVLFGCKNYYLL